MNEPAGKRNCPAAAWREPARSRVSAAGAVGAAAAAGTVAPETVAAAAAAASFFAAAGALPVTMSVARRPEIQVFKFIIHPGAQFD